MPICIECRYPVGALYTTYSKADDKALGKGVRLTQCPRCKRFADKYVEHDFVVLFIDLVLIKPQVGNYHLNCYIGPERLLVLSAMTSCPALIHPNLRSTEFNACHLSMDLYCIHTDIVVGISPSAVQSPGPRR